MQARLIDELILVGKRMRSATRLTVLAAGWLGCFFIAWCLSQVTTPAGLPPAMVALLFLGVCLGLTVVFCVLSRNWFTDLRWVAARIESHYPDLDSRLLTSLDQLEQANAGNANFLQHVVISQAVTHSSRNSWPLVVSPSKVLFSRMAACSGFLLLLAGSFLVANAKPALPLEPIETEPATLAAEASQPVELVSIEPGNTEVEKGTTLTVLAKFRKELPETAELVYEFANPAGEGGQQVLQRLPMNASFDDPVYAGQIADVVKPLTYWVEYGGESSERYYATLFEYPELVQLDFELDYPDFTGLPNRNINDGRRISALKGTRVLITARLNKDVSSCQLMSADQPPIELVADPQGEPVYRAELVISQSLRLELRLSDHANRENRLPPEIRINALDNQPPEIRITSPGRDVEVSPLEEFESAAKVSDDYGVVRAGLSYSVAGGKMNEVELASQLPGRKDQTIGHLIEMEALGVQPRQMVSYYFWAEDHVSDQNIRRVMSDMFFAEVREFNQIFRQGDSATRQQQQQQQQQQQNGQQQQAGELRKLQKEIINATWKLIRRENGDQPSENFSQDVGVIQDSQYAAGELVDQAVEKMQGNPEAAAVGAEIKDLMNQVVLTLQSAKDGDTASPLVDAVIEEQLVYQAILKLGSNENQVQQQQQQSSSSSSSQSQSRSRQQLQQLELQNDRNRYEEENQARQNQEQQNSEVRQALNRLRELARRQEDINQQLEQLQTALQEAQSDAEKKEIERRLKRLREQQQELLRDLDELKDQAEQNQENSLMQKAGEQLDEARENVRRSAEALEENRVSQAAAAGNRAQKQFEELRDEFRKGSANRFAEEMKDLGEKANRLKANQDGIADRLKELDEQSRKALRESDDRKEIADRLLDQKQEFDSILEDIKEVVRQAEETEPLLSQQLYDTYREASRGQTREAIDATENLLSRGFFNEARKTENTAGEGVDQLNRGIQQAAEDIVGDESDSLRRAEQTLQKLTRQINSEIRENSPDPPAPNSGDRPGEPENRAQPGKPGPSSAKNGKQQQDGDEQPGERKGKNQSQGKKSGKGAANPRGPAKKAGQASGQGNQQPNPSGEESSPRGQGGKKQESADPADANGQKQGRNDPGKQGGKQSPGKSSSQKKQNGKSAQSSGSQPGGSTQPPDPSAANPSPGRDPLEGYQRMFGGPSNGGAPRPITGDQYRQFSNDLREIEELLEDPKLRARAAEIREKAREIRVEMKRHSRKPNWDVVQDQIAEPLEVLRSEVARQLLLKENREALVPIDRDPVPTIFEEQVREYYRELSEVEK